MSTHGLSEDREGKGRVMMAHKFPLHLVPKDFSQSLWTWSLTTVNKSEAGLSILWEIYSTVHDTATKDSNSRLCIQPNSYSLNSVASLAKAKIKISTTCYLNRRKFISFTWKGTCYTGVGIWHERPQRVGTSFFLPSSAFSSPWAHNHWPPVPPHPPSHLDFQMLRAAILIVRGQIYSLGLTDSKSFFA